VASEHVQTEHVCVKRFDLVTNFTWCQTERVSSTWYGPRQHPFSHIDCQWL